MVGGEYDSSMSEIDLIEKYGFRAAFEQARVACSMPMSSLHLQRLDMAGEGLGE